MYNITRDSLSGLVTHTVGSSSVDRSIDLSCCALSLFIYL